MSIARSKCIFGAIAAVFIVTPAVAQSASKSVKTFRVGKTSVELFHADDDGTVRIDWRRVEAAAQSADLSDRDVARALMAVRDGTWKPSGSK